MSHHTKLGLVWLVGLLVSVISAVGGGVLGGVIGGRIWNDTWDFTFLFTGLGLAVVSHVLATPSAVHIVAKRLGLQGVWSGGLVAVCMSDAMIAAFFLILSPLWNMPFPVELGVPLLLPPSLALLGFRRLRRSSGSL